VSTTTLSTDSELTMALTAGTYVYEFLLICTTGANNNSGPLFSPNFTGSFTAAPYGQVRVLSGNYGGGNGTTGSLQVTATNVNGNLSTTTAGNGTFTMVTMNGAFVASTSGTLAVFWAQSISSSSADNLYGGSIMRVDKLA
jgi:hypothetical protein